MSVVKETHLIGECYVRGWAQTCIYVETAEEVIRV